MSTSGQRIVRSLTFAALIMTMHCHAAPRLASPGVRTRTLPRGDFAIVDDAGDLGAEVAAVDHSVNEPMLQQEFAGLEA